MTVVILETGTRRLASSKSEHASKPTSKKESDFFPPYLSPSLTLQKKRVRRWIKILQLDWLEDWVV